MPRAEETPQDQLHDSQQKTKNQKTNEKLLGLLRAYREKGHDSKKPSQEQQNLLVGLYLLIDTWAGIDRYTANADLRYKRGRLASTRGISKRAEEFADRIQKQLENNAETDGEYLFGWREDRGMSIAAYIWGIGENIALDMGREVVEDWLRVEKVLKKNHYCPVNTRIDSVGCTVWH